MTFLELCQALASESGTVQSGRPTTVVGQTGREAKIVRWVNMAWRSIQNSSNDWLWMRSSFLAPTIIGQQEYSGADLGLTRWGQWIGTRDRRERRYSVFLPSEPNSEGSMTYMDYDSFFVTQLRAPPEDAKPSIFTFTPDGKLALSPTPDAIYSIRGPYRKDVQPLTADGDIPEMPTRYHDLIVQAAMTYLTTADEAMGQIQLYQLQKLAGWSDLAMDQLPKMRLGGPAA